MSILVTGGTGTVGSEVVRQLLGRGEDVRVLVRSEEKAKALPEPAHGVVGNLDDRASLDRAMNGVDKVFLLTPISETEAEEGIRAVEAAKAAGVRHIVFMSVHDVEKCPQAPHFQSKIEIQAAIEKSGIPYTFIMPNNFYQNDVWFRQAMLDYGVYPQPFGDVGLSRVDSRDIAEAVANALTQTGHAGKRYALVGPDALTGSQTASIWGQALGKEIHYGGNDLDAWEKQAKQGLPGWMVDDFRIMYDFFQRQGLVATIDDLTQTRKILGREPRKFEDYARENARAWTQKES
ncbi:MAG: SDR family oxidoreductase [Thermoanaerobaculia bacterium]